MRCLKCWSEIEGEIAIFTKSCQHVFCERCSEISFKKELSCPFCDTVLAKDGVGKIVLKPDDTHIKKTSATMFGFEPEKLCETLQLGLEFWAKQKQNETIQHVQELRRLKKRSEEAEANAQKLSKVLEDERLKKKSLQNEREDLKRHISELETRYAEKARSMRKLSDLYSELRQVHRRLEVDLQGVRDTPEYDGDATEQREIEEQYLGRARPVSRAAAHDHNRKMDTIGTSRAPDVSERVSVLPGRDHDGDYEDGGRPPRPSARVPPSHHTANSAPLDTLFTLAPNHESRPFNLSRRLSREIGNGRRTRARSGDIRDGDEENEDPYHGQSRRMARP